MFPSDVLYLKAHLSFMEAHHIKIQCASKESECLAYEHEIKTYIIFIFPEVSKQVKIQFYCHIFSHI